MGDVPRISVNTMTFNQRDKVLALLGDLAAQDYPLDRLQVVVLDDGSIDATYEAVIDRAQTLPYELVPLHRERTGAYESAKRWNECIEFAGDFDVIVQVDDVRVRSDFLRRHASWHEAGGRQRVVTGAKFDADEITWDLAACLRSRLAGPAGEPREIRAWTACWGASLSYPRSLVDELSTSEFERPFDARMTGWGYHEVEFAYRAIAAGAQLVYDPGVGVFHQRHGPVSDAGRGLDHASQREVGMAKNIEYILAKHRLDALPRW